jgi:AcrR family transcriptional regulator
MRILDRVYLWIRLQAPIVTPLSREVSDVSEAAPAPSRRLRKKERTRHELYEAAMRLFAKRGFAAVTIAEICEAADVGRATFFLHFPSKAALLYEFNQRAAEDFRATLAEPRASARDEIRALVARMGRELSKQSQIMGAMLAEFFASPETLAAAPKHGAAVPELVTETIARGQELGEFSRRVDARLAAASFLATAVSLLCGQVFRRGERTKKEMDRQLLQLTFHGLARDGDRDA